MPAEQYRCYDGGQQQKLAKATKANGMTVINSIKLI
jgi:hypothetical protein